MRLPGSVSLGRPAWRTCVPFLDSCSLLTRESLNVPPLSLPFRDKTEGEGGEGGGTEDHPRGCPKLVSRSLMMPN